MAASSELMACPPAPVVSERWRKTELASKVYNRRDGPRISKILKPSGPARRREYNEEIVHGRLPADGKSFLDVVSTGLYDKTARMLRTHPLCASERNDITGDTALHISCARGFVNLTNLLLNVISEQNAVNNEGVTALHIAIQNGEALCAKSLCKAGFNITATTRRGVSCEEVRKLRRKLDSPLVSDTHVA